MTSRFIRNYAAAIYTSKMVSSMAEDDALTLALRNVGLKIVTSLLWENIKNAIICVGTSRSYPFPSFLIMLSYPFFFLTMHS